MNTLIYDLSVPQFVRSLTALKGILAKGFEWADKKKVSHEVLLQTRLVPDQFPLSRQIQIACDNAKGCCARLANVEIPPFEDNEQTKDQFMARIDKTIAFLKTLKPDQFASWDKGTVRFPWYPGQHMDTKTYLIQHALPNFYFHLATAYSILRASGVDLGKSDYLGQQDWRKDS